MKFALKFTAAAIVAATATGALAQQGETVKIAWLDPLSGLMAAVGTNQLRDLFLDPEVIAEITHWFACLELVHGQQDFSPGASIEAMSKTPLRLG